MTNYTTDASLRKIARVAGFMFLFGLIFPVLNWTFVLSKLNVADNVMATVNNVIANELLFRISIVNELILSLSVIVTALVLYILLKSVNKNIALFALFLRLAEGVIIVVIGLFGFVTLQILNGEEYLTVFTPEKLQIAVGFFLNAHISLFASFPMLFIGLGLTIFNYLFFKSKYIPGTIAGFGILSYSLIFIYALINILAPNFATMPIIQTIFWAPSCLFEMIVGVWLIVKGIRIQH